MNALKRCGGTITLIGFALVSFAMLAGCAPFNTGPRTASAIIYDLNGKNIGGASFLETKTGTRISVRVKGIALGRHGMHLHSNANCDDTKDAAGKTVKFGGAGAHFDPMGTMMHGSPYGTDHTNHAGDLENLVVDEDGDGYLDMTAKRVMLGMGGTGIVGHSIIIHANEDGFTNEPPNGGSGARIACGVIVSN